MMPMPSWPCTYPSVNLNSNSNLDLIGKKISEKINKKMDKKISSFYQQKGAYITASGFDLDDLGFNLSKFISSLTFHEEATDLMKSLKSDVTIQKLAEGSYIVYDPSGSIPFPKENQYKQPSLFDDIDNSNSQLDQEIF